MNNQNNINPVHIFDPKGSYRHFGSEGPAYMELFEAYELDNGQVVYAAVELDYSRETGLHVAQVAWLNKDGHTGHFEALPFEDQVWLMQDLNKLVNKHKERFFEEAFAYYELKQA